MTSPGVPRVLGDAALGIRLAVGGGRISRTALIRLGLIALGVGLATALLLVAASLGHAFGAVAARDNAQNPVTTPRAGVDPLTVEHWRLDRLGATGNPDIAGLVVHPTGPHAPVPPGLGELPGPGQLVVSPALHRLLTSPDGELLRERLPQPIVGEIGQAGLTQPDTLTFVLGAGAELDTAPDAHPTYGFGVVPHGPGTPPELIALVAVGVVALLLPVLAFVVTSFRIAGDGRDRRLAALRLLGCGPAQVKWIAAAETLVGAAAGLVLGAGLFLAGRAAAAAITVFGIGFFPSDLTPPWPLVVLVVLLVPALAVGSALFAQRRTMVEPLGVVRQARPVRRRMWWRLLLLVAGVVPLFAANAIRLPDALGGRTLALAAGATGLLAGVATMLPWLVERAAGRLRGGTPSWQLAVRRLQLDSGTSSRVIAGVTMMLAGAIALQSVVVGLADGYRQQAAAQSQLPPSSRSRAVSIATGSEALPAVLRAVRAVPGAGPVSASRSVYLRTADGTVHPATVAGCAAIERMFAVPCQDGDAFRNASWGRSRAPAGGTTVDIGVPGEDGQPGTFAVAGSVRLPQSVPVARMRSGVVPPAMHMGAILLTPALVKGVAPARNGYCAVLLGVEMGDAAVVERVAAALAPVAWRAELSVPSPRPPLSLNERRLGQVRAALSAGSVFVLLLAGLSMLVLATEQVRERRRPLAALVAAGVPRATLARSLLWQLLVPVLVGVCAAVAGGALLATLVLGVTGRPALAVDWAAAGGLGVAAVLVVLLVTAATLPLLHSVTHPESLRAE